MKNKLSTQELILLKHLFESENGLEPYTLFRKLKVPPWQIAHSISKLQNLDLIIFKSNRASLSDYGYNWFLASRHNSVGDKPWRKTPSIFCEEALRINQPYIPFVDKVDKNIKE